MPLYQIGIAGGFLLFFAIYSWQGYKVKHENIPTRDKVKTILLGIAGGILLFIALYGLGFITIKF